MNVIYAYPWDFVGDPAAADRVAALGVDAVALAASYHTTRAATPLHPEHRLVDARHAACYVPVRDTAWKRNRLVPHEPSWAPADSFGLARDALRAAGLPVHAWTVLTHNTLLGSAHPGVAVRNAFGESYPYALCPSWADVRDYCRTLVQEVIALGDPDALILEACGPLGFRHMGHHEKTDGADWSPAQTALLSLCFCTACVARYESAGLDAAELRALVRLGVDTGPHSVEEALGERAAAVRKARTGLTAELRDLLVAEARAARPGMPIALHANADPWATGPFATVSPGADVDLLIGNCWNTPEADEAGLRALAGLGPRVGAYVLALAPRPADGAALSWLAEAYTAAGAQEIHWYHFGLASAGRLSAIAEAIRSTP